MSNFLSLTETSGRLNLCCWEDMVTVMLLKVCYYVDKRRERKISSVVNKTEGKMTRRSEKYRRREIEEKRINLK